MTMKNTLIGMIILFSCVTAWADVPPYKLNISVPEGFKADTDPSLLTGGRSYVFYRQNNDTGSMAVIQFITRPPLPNQIPAYRSMTLNFAQGDLRNSHENYQASPSYELEGKGADYTCTDWTGSSNGKDFAGFMCIAAMEKWTVMVEAQDLASNAGKTLPLLKESLKAATYE